MSRRELYGSRGRVSPSPAIELTLHLWEVSGSRSTSDRPDQVALAVTEVGLNDPAALLQARDRAFDLDSVSLLRDGKAGFTHLLRFHPTYAVVIAFCNGLSPSGASSRASGPSIGIPQNVEIVEGTIIPPAVRVVEISDPTAAGAGIELIDQDVVQLQSRPLRARRVIVRLESATICSIRRTFACGPARASARVCSPTSLSARPRQGR